jgi:hypothetical protein
MIDARFPSIMQNDLAVRKLGEFPGILRTARIKEDDIVNALRAYAHQLSELAPTDTVPTEVFS